MYDREKVKLPMYKGRKHALVVALDEAHEMGVTMSDVARQINVTPQTLWIWKTRAAQNRNFLLPAEQVPALSRVLGVEPMYLRPDLWPDATWRF